MVQRYNILGRHTDQYSCLCSHAWSVEVSHGKIRVRPYNFEKIWPDFLESTENRRNFASEIRNKI